MVIAFGNRYIGKMQAIQAKSQAIAEFALTIKPTLQKLMIPPDSNPI